VRRIDKLLTDERPYAFLWNIDVTRLAYWNRFGMPDTVLSRFGDEEDVLAYWWFDDDRAKELSSAVRKGTALPPVPIVVDYDSRKEGRK
jgi:microcin C transport system substrate-binding protein